VKSWIGTSGWHYEHWKEIFYPEGLAKSDWLTFFASHFSTVELNNSFYHLPSEKAFLTWKEAVPQNFIFAVKGNRYITHIKRLKETQEAVQKMESRVRLLGEKLGPILYQLPPGLKKDEARLEQFLAQLSPSLKHAMEFRHSSWFNPSVYELLSSHNVALCIISLVDFPCPLEVTASFVYVRMHGSSARYSSCYTEEELDWWAKAIKGVAGNREVYVYFNNDVGGYAVENARSLQEKLG